LPSLHFLSNTLFKKGSPVLLLFLCVFPLKATASSLPKADADRSSISLGSAPSLALDIAINPSWMVGAAAGIPLLYDGIGFLRYDLRTSYLLLQKENLYIRAIGGTFGDINLRTSVERELSPFGIEAGIAIAYHFNEYFIGRVNIVAGIGFPRSTGLGLFAPSGGIELAFKPTENIEAIVGFNGNSDLLSVRYLF
jgi:hypothetical protein